MEKILDDMVAQVPPFILPNYYQALPVAPPDALRIAPMMPKLELPIDDQVIDQIMYGYFGVSEKQLEPEAALINTPVIANQITEKKELPKLEPRNSISPERDLTSLVNAEFWEARPVTFINFCRSSCHFCTELMPAWEELAASKKDQASIVFIDCDDNMDLCSSEAVISTPSMRLYSKSMPTSQGFWYDEYFGPRSVDALTDFVDTYLDEPAQNTRAPMIIELDPPTTQDQDNIGAFVGIEPYYEEVVESDVSSKSSRRKSVGSSSKDKVTPLVWTEENKDAARVSRFMQKLESRADTQKAKPLPEPDLRRRMARRLTELAPILERHWAINSGPFNYPEFEYGYAHDFGADDRAPDMGFGPGVETCLVRMSNQGMLSPPCSSAIFDLNLRLQELQEEEEQVPWYWFVLCIYGVTIFIVVGLLLHSRVQQKQLKGFHKEKTLRKDVLRTVHGDAELKAKVEQALGVELGEEAMTSDPMATFKKRLGCMGMFCITLPRVAIMMVYMVGVAMVPQVAMAILIPTLFCMSIYGYVMHCCCSPKEEDEEQQNNDHDEEQSSLLAYPAASRPLREPETNKDKQEAAFEAVPVVL